MRSLQGNRLAPAAILVSVLLALLGVAQAGAEIVVLDADYVGQVRLQDVHGIERIAYVADGV